MSITNGTKSTERSKESTYKIVPNAVVFCLLVLAIPVLLIGAMGDGGGSAPEIILIMFLYIGVMMFFGARTLLQAILKKRSGKSRGVPENFSVSEKISIWLVIIPLSLLLIVLLVPVVNYYIL